MKNLIDKISNLRNGEELYHLLMNKDDKYPPSALNKAISKEFFTLEDGELPLWQETKKVVVPPIKHTQNALVKAMLRFKSIQTCHDGFLNGVWFDDVNSIGRVSVCDGYAFFQLNGIDYHPDKPEFWEYNTGASEVHKSMPDWNVVIPVYKNAQISYFDAQVLLGFARECVKLTRNIKRQKVSLVFHGINFPLIKFTELLTLVAGFTKNNESIAIKTETETETGIDSENAIAMEITIHGNDSLIAALAKSLMTREKMLYFTAPTGSHLAITGT